MKNRTFNVLPVLLLLDFRKIATYSESVHLPSRMRFLLREKSMKATFLMGLVYLFFLEFEFFKSVFFFLFKSSLLLKIPVLPNLMQTRLKGV